MSDAFDRWRKGGAESFGPENPVGLILSEVELVRLRQAFEAGMQAENDACATFLQEMEQASLRADGRCSLHSLALGQAAAALRVRRSP